MVGNIINQLGGGSGIDTKNLVDQLVELERMPQEQRLTSRQTLLETQISDFGMLRSSLAKLEAAVAALGDPNTFNAKAVSLPQTSLLALTKLDAKAVAGDYQLQIKQAARAQSLSSGVFSSPSATIGKGTLTLQFGQWDDSQDNFAVNEAKAGASIVLDDTNNTLSGLRDAINKAGIGVQATIVSDGQGGYRLQVSSPSGANHELKISAIEDPDNLGLAQFSFDESGTGLSQNQRGQDALILVNGLEIARSSNRVTDVIDGLEFDIFNANIDEVISINITEDRSAAELAIRDFVDAYNVFLSEMQQLTDFNSERGEQGSLRNDSLTRNLMQSVRNTMTSAVPGLDNNFNFLAAVGIRTRLDGSPEINEALNEPNTNFQAIMANNYEQVRDFFVPNTSVSDSRITINNYSGRTQSGSYEVVILQEPAKGGYNGAALDGGVTFPFDTTGKDYSFTARVDSTSAAVISLPPGKIYNSGAEMAADFQALINMDQTLRNANLSVSVSFNNTTNAFEFVSQAYGSNSRVSFASVGADMAELGISASQGYLGRDVRGTVDGVEGFGLGNVLLPALGSAAEGLSLIIAPGATSATLNFSRGFSGNLSNQINSFLQSNGLIKEREDNIKKDLEKVADDKVTMERRSDAFRARLEAQFLAMEMIVRSLNNTGTFLDGLNDRLPFTAPKR